MTNLSILHDMTLFVEVARTANFSLASLALGVPGATLSRRIAAMERELGVRLFNQESMPEFASTVLPIYFLEGVQLLCSGIMGEYLAKIYSETKHRPRYIIEKII